MRKEDILNRLQEMKSRFNSGFSSIDREWLDSIYFELFGKVITNTGCSSCYKDAYMEIYHKIKSLKEMPKKSNYVLKPGALITFFGESMAYSNANLTDEVAERYLAQNPDLIEIFQSFPLDYPQRIAARKDGVAYEPVEEVDAADIEEMKLVIVGLQQENEQLKAENQSLKEHIEQMKAQETETEVVADDATEADAEVEATEVEAEAEAPKTKKASKKADK